MTVESNAPWRSSRGSPDVPFPNDRTWVRHPRVWTKTELGKAHRMEVRMTAGSLPHGILFDMDGLMLRSEGLWSEADRKILERYGREYDPDLKKHFMGCERIESARRFCEAYGIRERPEVMAGQRSELARSFYSRGVELMPGLEELVEDMKRWGKRLAVATSAERGIVDIVQRKLPVFREFTAVVCADDVQRGKPSPDLFLEAARRIGTAPAASLVLEDAPNGVAAALAAGMKVIVVPEPSVTGESVRGATARVNRLTEISRDLVSGLYRDQGCPGDPDSPSPDGSSSRIPSFRAK